MRTPEIGSLVTGVIAIVGIALVLGQYGRLESWARHQAMEAMMWRRGLPYFFAPEGGSVHKLPKPGHAVGKHAISTH